MRARRNVSQGYATNKDPLQPGPSPRIKSVSATNTIFRSSNDIMHDVFLSNESRFLHASRKRARPEEDAADVDSTIFSRIDEAGTTMTLVNSLDLQAPSRLIKPLRKPGRTALQINSLPASMWSNNPAECTNDVEEEEEEDWSTFDTGSKQFEPMLLS
ncbi:hypothetical protein E1B28_004376 [Marasmius oreades]|nr:uncharacterized protein E1B28_004376 [Marasmius oreades]KAG7096981.1 hypothetical protein E1B28_004376 [Marasmius oreades]